MGQMIDKRIVDWLNVKSKTDEDCFVVGMIVGTISALNQKVNKLEQQNEQFMRVDFLRLTNTIAVLERKNAELTEQLDGKCDNCIDRNKKVGAIEFCEYLGEKVSNVVEFGTGKSITLGSLLLGYINGKDNSGKCD